MDAYTCPTTPQKKMSCLVKDTRHHTPIVQDAFDVGMFLCKGTLCFHDGLPGPPRGADIPRAGDKGWDAFRTYRKARPAVFVSDDNRQLMRRSRKYIPPSSNRILESGCVVRTITKATGAPGASKKKLTATLPACRTLVFAGEASAGGENPKPVFVGCHCKKSRCLKLYCECFGRGVVCGSDCWCRDCHNTPAHKQSAEWLAAAAKMEATADTRRKACTCRKSNCLKKYCVCYANGRKCSDKCRCVDCGNGKGETRVETSQNEYKLLF